MQLRWTREAAADLERIADYLMRAVKSDPDSALSLAAYGLFLDRSMRYQEAEPYLSRALDLDPGHAKARTALDRIRGTERP